MGFLSWNGRTQRLRFFLITVLCAVCCAPVEAFVSELSAPGVTGVSLWVLFWLWVQLSAAARRSRDAGLNPWMALLLFVPIVGLVYQLVLFFRRSRPC